MASIQKRIIAHHLILSGYGFWLANDPRGSGSEAIRQEKFEDLGTIHPGRKSIQPSREELREFYRSATPRLEHSPIWFDERLRTFIGHSLGDSIEGHGYTVWACSVGSNHVHLCLRVHRDRYQEMWDYLAEESRGALVNALAVEAKHPVWADRPYSVYLHTPGDIRRVIGYIAGESEEGGVAWANVGFCAGI